MFVKNYYGVANIVGIYAYTAPARLKPDVISSEEDQEDAIKFDIVMSYTDFENMYPQYGGVYNKRGYLKRSYFTFGKLQWTHILQSKIYERTKEYLKCIFMFKRAKIMPNSSHAYANIVGSCKSCNSRLEGKIFEEPQVGRDITVHFQCIGNFRQYHGDTMKRPLSGTKRSAITKWLIDTNEAPSQIRARMADETM